MDAQASAQEVNPLDCGTTDTEVEQICTNAFDVNLLHDEKEVNQLIIGLDIFKVSDFDYYCLILYWFFDEYPIIGLLVICRLIEW